MSDLDIKNIEIDWKQCLGGGQFAKVYVASYNKYKSDLQFVVKVYKEKYKKQFDETAGAELASLEGHILLKAKHNHVVKCFGILNGFDGELRSVAIIMEYVTQGNSNKNIDWFCKSYVSVF